MQRMPESLPHWQPGVSPRSNPFLAKTTDLFEKLKVVACITPFYLICCLHAYSAFFQKQVDISIQITINREAAERAESKRIAELFPIEWHSHQSGSSDSSHEPPRVKEPIRTPSPVGNQNLSQNSTPESPRVVSSGISRSETATRRFSPIRKSIFKTPALSFVKEDLQAKAGSVKSIKSLRNQFSKQSQFQDLELPQSSPTKCGMLSNRIQFPAPYGLS